MSKMYTMVMCINILQFQITTVSLYMHVDTDTIISMVCTTVLATNHKNVSLHADICLPTQFYCSYFGYCINASLVCNGVNDCYDDWEDELYCRMLHISTCTWF